MLMKAKLHEPVSLEMFNKAATGVESKVSNKPQDIHNILDQGNLKDLV